MRFRILTGAVLTAGVALATYWSIEPNGWRIDNSDIAGSLVNPPEHSSPADPPSPSLRWVGPDGEPLPFTGDSEIEEFLANAQIVSKKRIHEGVNGIDKLLLERNGIRAHAAFRDVSVHKRNVTLADGSFSLSFRDDCVFEVAAYRLSRMLGLDNVPPAVLRRVRNRKGTLQLWIEGAFTEKQRIRDKRPAPEASDWRRQVQTMHLFDRLIANDDRNQGNILIDGNWKLWMIDHTRAFRTHKKPRAMSVIVECERGVWERLLALNPETVRLNLKGILTKGEIKALFKRRALLISHLRSRIERLGEHSVLL